jgi:F-type H+-transporting ATPase subunit b
MHLFADPEFWVLLAVAIFAAIVWKPASRYMTGTLDERATRISGELDEARKLRDEAEQLLTEYQRKLREAASEAQAIVTHAREEAERIAAQASRDLQQSLERRQRLAEERIAQAESKAVDEIRAVAVDVAINAAREVIVADLDERRGAALLDTAIASLPQPADRGSRRQPDLLPREIGAALADHDRRGIGVAETAVGITDASATRRPVMPRTQFDSPPLRRPILRCWSGDRPRRRAAARNPALVALHHGARQEFDLGEMRRRVGDDVGRFAFGKRLRRLDFPLFRPVFRRRIRRVGALQRDLAATVRTQLIGDHRKPGPWMQPVLRPVGAERLNRQFDIG